MRKSLLIAASVLAATFVGAAALAAVPASQAKSFVIPNGVSLQSWHLRCMFNPVLEMCQPVVVAPEQVEVEVEVERLVPVSSRCVETRAVVSVPSEGQTYKAGSEVTVIFAAESRTLTGVDVALSVDGADYETVAENVYSGSGYYKLTLPAGVIGTATLRITLKNGADAIVSAESGAFSIVE